MTPVVAIVGRPNVGKSTLFNRLVGFQKAIVDDEPGVTRDRNYAAMTLDERPILLVDTGGFEPDDEEGMMAQVRRQALLAIEEADVIVFLADGRHGLSPHDRELVDVLRRAGRPFIMAVNKIDGEKAEALLGDFYALGIEPVLPLSAAHGYGVRDFKEELLRRLPPGEPEAADEAEGPIQVAVIGRPNVGKSSLVNRLTGSERALVTDIPGTTRDPVDIEVVHDGRPYVLVDTAGIRRKGRVSLKVEKFSVMRALRSLDRCDVALLLVDALEGITDQDAHVAGYALERGRGLILVFNKWDAVKDKNDTRRRILDAMDLKLKFLAFCPHVMVSAKTGLGCHRLFPLVNEVYAQYTFRAPTGRLNRILEEAVAAHQPPYAGRTRLKFYYGTQASTRPPTFVLFANKPDEVHFSYQRYLVNTFRTALGLDKTPLKVILRPRRKESK